MKNYGHPTDGPSSISIILHEILSLIHYLLIMYNFPEPDREVIQFVINFVFFAINLN